MFAEFRPRRKWYGCWNGRGRGAVLWLKKRSGCGSGWMEQYDGCIRPPDHSLRNINTKRLESLGVSGWDAVNADSVVLCGNNWKGTVCTVESTFVVNINAELLYWIYNVKNTVAGPTAKSLPARLVVTHSCILCAQCGNLLTHKFSFTCE